MTSIFKLNGKAIAFTKGAPQFLIPSVTHFIDRQGKITNITTQFTKQLSQTISEFASESLRTILLAYREVEANEEHESA